MRIAVGGIEHESSSFIVRPTPLESFGPHSRTADQFDSLGEANNIIDGLVKGVRDAGAELIPLYYGYSHSGGLCTPETFNTLKARLLSPLRAALPVDGVLLSLHGAFSAQGIDDADGAILEAVRQEVGPEIPIISVHDLHCNLTSTMVQNANAMIVERTYPHTDMAERALEAAALMVRALKGEVWPTMAIRPLPLFWAAAHMISAQWPMKDAVDELNNVLKHPGVLTASIGVGYQWADSPIVGASTIVVPTTIPSLPRSWRINTPAGFGSAKTFGSGSP